MQVGYTSRTPFRRDASLTSPIQHCKECVELLGEYIEGTLSPERSKELEDHLSTCPPCITFVRTYRATRKLCRHALAREMPEELAFSLKSFLGKHVPGFACAKADSEGAAEADSEPEKV